jgi:hypothetical protein
MRTESAVLFRASLIAVASLGIGLLASGCNDNQTVSNPDIAKLDLARCDGTTSDIPEAGWRRVPVLWCQRILTGPRSLGPRERVQS